MSKRTIGITFCLLSAVRRPMCAVDTIFKSLLLPQFWSDLLETFTECSWHDPSKKFMPDFWYFDFEIFDFLPPSQSHIVDILKYCDNMYWFIISAQIVDKCHHWPVLRGLPKGPCAKVLPNFFPGGGPKNGAWPIKTLLLTPLSVLIGSSSNWCGFIEVLW